MTDHNCRWYIVGTNRVYGVPAASVPEYFADEISETLRDLAERS